VLRERAVEAAGKGNNGEACGCALAASMTAGTGLDLANQRPSLKGSGEARSPREAPAGSTHRPFRPEKCFEVRR
jgi:hypothetical protein